MTSPAVREYRVRFTYRLGLVIRLLPVLVAGWFVVWGPWSTLEGLSTFVTALRSIAPLFFWLLAASFLWAVTLLRPTRAAIDGSKLVLPAGSSFRSTTIRLEDIETATLDSAGELTIARASGRRIVFDTAMLVDPGGFVADLVAVLGERFVRRNGMFGGTP